MQRGISSAPHWKCAGLLHSLGSVRTGSETVILGLVTLQVVRSWHFDDVDCDPTDPRFMHYFRFARWVVLRLVENYEQCCKKQRTKGLYLGWPFRLCVCSIPHLNSTTACAPLSDSFLLWRLGAAGGQRAGKVEGSDDVRRIYMGLCMWHWLFV